MTYTPSYSVIFWNLTVFPGNGTCSEKSGLLKMGSLVQSCLETQGKKPVCKSLNSSPKNSDLCYLGLPHKYSYQIYKIWPVFCKGMWCKGDFKDDSLFFGNLILIENPQNSACKKGSTVAHWYLIYFRIWKAPIQILIKTQYLLNKKWCRILKIQNIGWQPCLNMSTYKFLNVTLHLILIKTGWYIANQMVVDSILHSPWKVGQFNECLI